METPLDTLATEPCAYAALARRLGPDHLARRRRLQERAASGCRLYDEGRLLRPERLLGGLWIFKLLLRLTGQWARGRRNLCAVTARENVLAAPGLPAAFDGYRLLQLSDLHVDVDERLVPACLDAVAGRDYDAAVVTGDFCLERAAGYARAMELTEQLTAGLDGPVYAVLGNHDPIEIVPHLEAFGITVLLNEHTWLRQGDAKLCLAGVDDAWYYRTADLPAALAGVDSDAAVVLLSHSPDFCDTAAEAGVDVMLCGHTHGGQICLPGGRPVICHSRLGPPFIRGAWRHGELTGYTAPGVGGSGLPVRYCCPPEVTFHTLRRTPAPAGA